MVDVIRKIKLFCHRRYGFISPSINLLRILPLYSDNRDYVGEYESLFAKGVGEGICVSFGAGRMAFYSILKCWDIGQGDEVVLTGFTCSVMANVVFRMGADVKYCDIDQDSLGMSPEYLKKIISSKTRVVVAQHSFGIPCKIDEIRTICQNHNIYLVEDCALSYMSKYKGKYVGDFGDAAIFATDHTKPINTLIGGMAYTKDQVLAQKLRKIQSAADVFGKEHIRGILKRYIWEHRILKNNWYNGFAIMMYMDVIRNKICRVKKHIYLSGDTNPSIIKDFYPYPAKFPNQLAQIGLEVCRQYQSNLSLRRKILMEFIDMFKEKRMPSMYFSDDADIVPLRIVCFSKDKKGGIIRDYLSGIWFDKPIINTSCNLRDFNYNGNCKNSENIGDFILNIPVLFNRRERRKMLSLVDKYKNEIQ